MSLLGAVDGDLRTAMKASESLMAKAEPKNLQIQKGRGPSEDQVRSVWSVLAKKRGEASEQFSLGGRDDLVDQERRELNLLQSSPVLRLSDARVEGLISEMLADVSATNEMGWERLCLFSCPASRVWQTGSWQNARVPLSLSSPH